VYRIFAIVDLVLSYLLSGYGGYGQHSAAQHLALGLLTQLMQKSSISTKVSQV